MAEVVTDPFWLDELSSRRFFAATFSGGPQAAVEAASSLLQRRGSGPFTITHLAVSYSLVRVGRLEEAIELLWPLADSGALPAADGPWYLWAMLQCLGAALVFAGRLGEAEDLLVRAYDVVADQPAAEARASVADSLAVLHLEQGLPLSAFRRASESYSALHATRPKLHRPVAVHRRSAGSRD